MSAAAQSIAAIRRLIERFDPYAVPGVDDNVKVRAEAETAVAALEQQAVPQRSAVWSAAEAWESLAWELCADENGEESCSELIWEGGPVPEPWGERWLKYEDEAKRLIALVQKHVATTSSEASEPAQDEPTLIHGVPVHGLLPEDRRPMEAIVEAAYAHAKKLRTQPTQAEVPLLDVDAYQRKYANVITLTDDMRYGYECLYNEIMRGLQHPSTQQAAQPPGEKNKASHYVDALFAKTDESLAQMGKAEQAEAPSERADAIMAQAQVFASAWSMVGGPNDSMSCLEDARKEKADLDRMVRAALATQQSVPRYTHADVAHAHAEGYKLGLTQVDRPTQQAAQGEAVLPRPGSPEASAMIDSLLAEYQWPSNPKNAARAGFEAARRMLATPPAPGQVERDREDADYLCKLVDAIGKDVLGVLKKYGDAQAAIGLMASRIKEAIRAARSSEGEQA